MDRPEQPPMTREQRMAWLAAIKDGDWLFYDFKLSQVDEQGVSNGAIYTGCGIDRCRTKHDCGLQPLDMRIKRISDEFAYTADLIHKLKCNDLNHPELHDLLVHRWTQFCNGELPRDGVGRWCADTINTIEQAVQIARQPMVDGVRIFGRS